MKLRLLTLTSLFLVQCAQAPTRPDGSIATTSIPLEASAVLRIGSTTGLSADVGAGGKLDIVSSAGAIALPPSEPSDGGGRDGVRVLRVEPPHPASPPPGDHAPAFATYTWRASDGRISGQGPSVTYTAPEHPDTVRVDLTVQQKNGTTLTGSTTIIVYKQWVILKADDLRYEPSGIVSPGWRRFVDYVKEKRIRASVGIIGNEIERGGAPYASWIRNLAADSRFELWNHGYDHELNYVDGTGHTVSEFSGTSYEHQLDHLVRTQALARERCGVALHAFGAPGNAFDSNTARAMDAVSELGIWFFGAPYSAKLVLPHTIDIEDPIFEPNVAGFETAYDPRPPCVTYQIHPKDWSQDRFDAFTRIIDFLIAQNVTFVTPSAFARISDDVIGRK